MCVVQGLDAKAYPDIVLAAQKNTIYYLVEQNKEVDFADDLCTSDTLKNHLIQTMMKKEKFAQVRERNEGIVCSLSVYFAPLGNLWLLKPDLDSCQFNVSLLGP